MYSKAEQRFLVKLGLNIKKKRLSLKLSQAQLAFELGTDARHVRRIEGGEINTSFLTLKKIADIFEVKVSDLLAGV